MSAMACESSQNIGGKLTGLKVTEATRTMKTEGAQIKNTLKH